MSRMNSALDGDGDAMSPAAKKAKDVKADFSGKTSSPNVAKESTWLTAADKSKEKSAAPAPKGLDGIVPSGGKVTISPARLKEKGSAASSSSSAAAVTAAPATSEKPQALPGAVTITKLSTGTSQQVDSKDLKNLLSGPDGKINSGSNGIRVPQSSSDCAKKSSNSYSVQKQKKLQQQQLQQHQESASGGGGGGGSDISCGKCKQAFSTKEAMRLHTCNSILDSQYLTDSADRHRMCDNSTSSSSAATDSKSSSPGSSLSRNSSRSNSPLLNHHSAGGKAQQLQPPNSSASQLQRSQSSPAAAAADKAALARQSSDPAVPCKLIKDERENKLMIEGRPKLSVSKVGARPDASGLQKQKRPEAETVGSGGVKRKAGEAAAAGAAGKDWPKIRIKVGGMSIERDSSSVGGGGGSGQAVVKPVGGGKPAMVPGGGRKAEDEGPPYSFTFNGKPTYSPSRVEPSQSSQDKGKAGQNATCVSR